MIAPEEMGAALVQVIEVSYGISPAEAVAEACKLMGFRRTGAKLAEAFAEVLGLLIEEGDVQERESFLHAPKRRESEPT